MKDFIINHENSILCFVFLIVILCLSIFTLERVQRYEKRLKYLENTLAQKMITIENFEKLTKYSEISSK